MEVFHREHLKDKKFRYCLKRDRGHLAHVV